MGRWDKPKQDEKWNERAKKFTRISSRINQILIPNSLKRFIGRINVFDKIGNSMSKFMQKYVITLTFRQWVFAVGFLFTCFIVMTFFGKNVTPYPLNVIPLFIILFLIFAIDYDDDDDDDDEEPKDDGGIVIKNQQETQNFTREIRK